MFLTQAEAEEKICPHISVDDSGDRHVVFCKGKDCMAWRWRRLQIGNDIWWDGYCGLHGLPTENGPPEEVSKREKDGA